MLAGGKRSVATGFPNCLAAPQRGARTTCLSLRFTLAIRQSHEKNDIWIWDIRDRCQRVILMSENPTRH